MGFKRRQRRPAPGRKQLLAYADSMQRKPTKHERILRDALIARPLFFEHQRLFEPYIVDFYFPQWRLVVEVDGASHNGHDAQEKDRRRTEQLLRRKAVGGVVRFTNKEVKRDPSAVIDQVVRAGAQVLTGVFEQKYPTPTKPRKRPTHAPAVRIRRRREA